MTFLHKLARRLAVAHPRGGISFLLFLVGCQTPEEREFLSPTPGQPGSSQITTVVVSPKIASLKPGEQVRFTASALSAKGSVVAAEIDWSATGGTIEPDGTFASDRHGLFSVAARVRTAPHLADSASVSVFTDPRDVISLVVSPDSSILFEGEGLQLSALARRADGQTVQTSALEWSATGGRVDGSGWYTATAEGDYRVLATSKGVTSYAAVQVKKRNRLIQGLEVTPGTVSLGAGKSQQFGARLWYADGTSEPAEVSWSASGGSITSSGLFTAGAAAGNYRVIGRFRNGSFADTAFVAVQEAAIVGLSISPVSVTMAPGGSQQYAATALMSDGSTRAVGAAWRATGGTISTTGLYTASAGEGEYRVIGEVAGLPYADTSLVAVSAGSGVTGLVLNPSSATVPAGATRQFAVTATYADGSTRTPQVSYSATGGSITSGGLFTAGAVAGAFQVVALDPVSGKADTSDIQVTPPALVQLVVNPGAVEIPQGQSVQFAVAGVWTDGSPATPPVVWSATGGVISSSGLYAPAGTATGSQLVIARHEASGLADTAVVTVTVPPPALTSLVLSPASATVIPGGVQQFAVLGTWSDGTQGVPPVAWSAEGGTVSNAGLFTAPSTQGTYRVIARHTGSTLADTSLVTVTVTAPVLTGLTISPEATTLQASGSRQFAVTGVWSDGSTSAPAVTWTASGGTVTHAGLYFAPAGPGTYFVTATATGTTHSATATVTVTEPLTVTGITVTPGTASVTAGQTQQFSATASYSNGGTGSASVTWSATGGTISSTGLYLAGQTAGTYLVIAACACGLADTSVVAVASAAPTLVGLTLSPTAVTLRPGQQASFSAQGWVSGSNTPVTPSVTWSSSGGQLEINGAGAVYTAGSTPGTFWVKIQSTTSTHWDSATVTIPSPTRIELLPSSLSLVVNEARPIGVEAVFSDGTRASVSPVFDATGGTVTAGASLAYVAGGVPGLYRLIANYSGLADTAAVSIASAGEDGQHPNMPVGLTPFAEQSFSSLDLAASTLSGQWSHGNWLTNLRAVSESTAPRSGFGTVATVYPAGLPGGESPVRISGWNSLDWSRATRYKELYVSLWMMIPGTGFENQSVGTKLWYVGYGNTNQYNDGFLMLRGSGSTSVMSAMRLVMYISETDDRDGPSFGWDQNITPAPLITVGAWHHIEVYLNHGTVNTRDGVLRIWVDGQKVTDYTSMKFLDARNDFIQGFFTWTWTPVWGGVGGTRTREDMVLLDHVMLAGRE